MRELEAVLLGNSGDGAADGAPEGGAELLRRVHVRDQYLVFSLNDIHHDDDHLESDATAATKEATEEATKEVPEDATKIDVSRGVGCIDSASDREIAELINGISALSAMNGADGANGSTKLNGGRNGVNGVNGV